LETRLAEIPVTALVNNAGVGALGPTSNVQADAQQALLNINVIALTRLSLAAIQRFKAAGRGTLINIASVMALMPSAGGGAYSGSKAYVLNFSRSLGLELAGSGIGVHVVMPGPVRTEFFSSQGLNDAVFPDSSYVSADDLVKAVFAGVDQDEEVITPTLSSPEIWRDYEIARSAFMREVMGGEIAAQYKVG
jgi:short-subunit dehydrogenase